MENYSIFAYLISGIFFILALRGLSSPETAKRGNVFGILGMIIAIVTTLLLPVIESYVFIALAILNEIIWRTQSTDIWVNFKVFGILPITFIFTLTQFSLIKKYYLED